MIKHVRALLDRFLLAITPQDIPSLTLPVRQPAPPAAVIPAKLVPACCKRGAGIQAARREVT